jgi:hypothetical protein
MNTQHNYQDYISSAIDMVSAWDLPDGEFLQAVADQAKLMSGDYLIDAEIHHPTSPYLAHQ